MARWARVPTERALATCALVVVALHVVDDSFLQPQPGTSAGDHLVSGLVPLALLSLTTWAYRRLRAGLRAAIALSIDRLGATRRGSATTAESSITRPRQAWL